MGQPIFAIHSTVLPVPPTNRAQGVPFLHILTNACCLLFHCDSYSNRYEDYAMWNKPTSETQILYDLAYLWNLMNKINQWTKQKQKHRYVEQTDSCWRGGRRDTGWKKVKGLTKKLICMTHGHRQWCGDCLGEWGGLDGFGQIGEN